MLSDNSAAEAAVSALEEIIEKLDELIEVLGELEGLADAATE